MRATVNGPDPSRARRLNDKQPRGGPVVYWMSRDQRARDNWALLFASGLAAERRSPLLVSFCLVPSFPGANLRHYEFMLGTGRGSSPGRWM